MAFSSATVTIGKNTKKSDYDRVLDNTQYLKAEDVHEKKTFQSSTVFNATATFNSGVIRTLSGIETLVSGTSWVVPDNIYRVKATIIGGGGGGAGASLVDGSTGGTTTWDGTSVTGGPGGYGFRVTNGRVGGAGLRSGNGGMAGMASGSGTGSGTDGQGGDIAIILSTVTPGETITYAIGAGGAGGAGVGAGGAGGRGEIILEY